MDAIYTVSIKTVFSKFWRNLPFQITLRFTIWFFCFHNNWASSRACILTLLCDSLKHYAHQDPHAHVFHQKNNEN